jgi:1,4-dihydroxy-2-naphthoate octaprenyltransferase
MKKTNFFNHHLVETGENYLEHFLFTFVTSLWLLLSSVILLIHSVCPFIFAINASKHVKKINEVMQKRTAMLLERRLKKVTEES